MDREWLKVAELLNEVNTLFLFHDYICPEKVSYTVAKGDSLVKNCAKI